MKQRVFIYRFPFDLMERDKKYNLKPKHGFKKMLNEVHPDIIFVEKDLPDEDTYILYYDPIPPFSSELVKLWADTYKHSYKEILQLHELIFRREL